MPVYLDNAATTQIDPEVIEAMIPFMKEHYGNPSSIHSYGRTTRAGIERARKTVASYLNCSPGEICFTSGGTEANNMAICRSIADYGIKHAITSLVEHHAVLHTLQAERDAGNISLSFVKLDGQGKVDLTHLEELLSMNPNSFVSLMHANNEIGTRLPLKETSVLVKKYGGIFHSDTVQTMGHYSFDLQDISVDFINCAAHKFHGPKGVGFIFIRSGSKLHPLIHGGSQERNMRGGTENLYGIVGLAKAMELAYSHLEEHQNHVSSLKKYMISLLKEHISGVQFNGDLSDDSLYTVLNVSFPSSKDGEMMLFNLDINGIAASGGSACSSGSNIGSHVLGALNVDPERTNVRFSFSKFNTKEDIDFTIAKLREIIPAEPLVNLR
ncbi:MAG: cysteine desulfurase family protein [Bacteroidia bacterium]